MATRNAKEALEKLNKKYGVTGNTNSYKSDNGKQSSSASPTRTSGMGKTSSQEALEKLNKKYGVTGTTTTKKDTTKKNETPITTTAKTSATTKPTTYSSAVKHLQDRGVQGASSLMTETEWKRRNRNGGSYQDYLDNEIGKYVSGEIYNPQSNTTSKVASNKASGKTTITSNLSDEERNARIKEIKSELNDLGRARSGLNRAKIYGNVDDIIAENNARTSALSKELKELERVGTFSASELKQFEIDDAKQRVSAARQKVQSYGQRPSTSVAEDWKKSIAELNEAESNLSRLEAEKAAYKKIEKLDELNAHTKHITSMIDFAENSKYSPLKPKTDAELKAEGYKQDADGKWYRLYGLGYREGYTGEDSDLYTYINDPNKRLSLEVDREMLTGENTYKMLGYHTLTEEEKGAFNYLYHQDRKNGTNTAEEYLQSIGALLENRAMELEAKRYGELSKESPVLMSGVSLYTNLENAMMFPVKVAATTTGEYDNMPMLDMYGNRTEAIRGAVSENMPVWGKVLYNAGMSIGDMGTAMLAGGGNAKMIQAVMSSAAGSSAITEAKENGESDGLAFVKGLGSAAIEWATERYSVEAILKKPETFFGFLTTNTLTEGTEEGASNLANWALDTIVSEVFGDPSEMEQRIYYLMVTEGLTEKEALGIAFKEKMASLGEDVLVGGLTGFGMSTAVGTTSVVADAVDNRNKKNEIATKSKDNKVILDGLIKEGKDIGGESAKIATQIETKLKNGKKVSTGEVKSLINATEEFKKNDTKTTTSTPSTSRKIDTVSGIELLEARKRGTVTEDMLETFTLNDIDITAEEVKTVTGFGDKGSEYIANKANVSGVTFSQALSEVRDAYLDGYTNAKSDNMKSNAYTAGQMDRQTSLNMKKQNAQNVVVHKDGGFSLENLPDDVTQRESEVVDRIMSSLGTRGYMTTGLEGNAEYNRATGEVPIDKTFQRKANREQVSVVYHAAHEGLHRVVHLAPEEGSAFVYEMYKHLSNNNQIPLADIKRKSYARQGGDIDFDMAMEEVSANSVLYLYNGNEANFKKAIDSIANGTNTKAKQGLRRFIDYLNRIIRNLRDIIAGKSARERAKIQHDLKEISRLRDMFETAYAKAVENKKAIESRSSDTKSAKNLEIKTNEEYNGNVNHSLKDKETTYNEKDYRNFGWARANGILNEGQNADYRSKFADAKVGRAKFNKTKKGEYIIPVSDIYDADAEGIDNVLVFAKGTITNPVITSVIKINENDETSLDTIRRNIYELERRGIQQKAEGIIGRYYANGSGIMHFREYYESSRNYYGERFGKGGGRENSPSTRGTKNYSLKDSEGNTLTESQQEYFKDSKIRDENGNLLVVYHGSPNKNVNVFSYDYVGSVGGSQYGYGFYFTPNQRDANLYAQGIGETKPYYLNITNPIYSKEKDLRNRLDELFDRLPIYAKNSLIEKYGDLDAAKQYFDEYISKHGNGVFLSLFPDKANIDPEVFNKQILANMGYDGIVYKEEGDSDEYVVFKSEQAKLTTNENPTSNPNINYSLKENTENLSTEDKNVVDELGEGAKFVTNDNGDMLIATNKNKSTVMYSLKTYNDGGKEALEKALADNGHTTEEINETLSWVDDAADYLTILAAGYAKSHNYTALSNHLTADVITNVKTGKQVISSIVNNGDYPVNIDLALICKKRVAYMNLMNRLIDDGIFDKVNYGGEAIAKVNQLLRADGFETACLGCFVESRRLQFQTWAETIVAEWNAEVDKRTKGAENFNFADGKAILTDAEMDALAEELKNAGKKNAQGNLNLGQGSVQTRMGRLLDKVPSLRKHLTVADLLKPEGLTALRGYDSNLFSLVKSRYGAASPKIVQDYNPYASEISMLTFSSVKNITSKAIKGADSYRRKVKAEMGGTPVKQKGETVEAFKKRKAEFNTKAEDEAMRRYLYDIGGARIQSFSDFMIENVFDYIQIFADLSAKRLPLHGYTKEIVALRLLGMTGAKWNGSWIAHTDRSMGREYAGLLPASEAKNGNAILVHTEDGDFAIGFDDYDRYKASNKKTFIQSIGMKDMVALQLDPRYSPYVGSITIGVSDKQILAMLDSPLFRFVIPYHSSGMLPQFAKLVGVDMYNDYTDYQNTSVKKWFDAYGNPCNPIKDSKGKVIKVDTSYNFNAEVQKTGDAKNAADNYLKWCDRKHPVYKDKKLVGYTTFKPKFSDSPFGTDFSKHENYYKLLEDFNVYDNITEESAVQGAVTMTFPSEENRLSASEMEAYKDRLRETGLFTEKEIEKYSKIADKTFKELVADEVKGRAEYQKAQEPKWENTVQNVEQMLLGEHKRDVSHSRKDDTTIPSIEERAGITIAIEDMQNGVRGASQRLSKYVDKGVISTEAYKEMVKKYGAIPKGENPHREVKVPLKTADDKKVSQTVRTILEAKATPDEALPTIEKMVEDGVFSYDVYSDKQAVKDADDYIKEYGWTGSYNDWIKDVEEGIVSKQHTVMGWKIYNNAVNTATTTTSETERRTATETAISVLDAMVRHQRNAAQALQATRVLKKLSPETQLYGIQKSVSAYQKEMTAKYGEKAPNLKIDEKLAERFLNAKTEKERLDAEIEIYKDIGRQMPSDWLDMWNAWRYIAMLTNLRTHGRNIVGNAGFAPVVIAKDLTATAIESAVYHLGGKKMLRGKALVWGSKKDRALLKAAWEDYKNVADIVSNGGKYNDSALSNKHIQDGRRIFKGILSPVEWVRRGNSWLLELEDVWFSKPHYAYALAQYCKANNITPEQISRGKAIAPAREYAIKEAQKATYKDTNAFSQKVSELGRSGKKKSAVDKAIGTVVEGVLPFRKTPANILVRGIEYSPIGFIKGLTRDLYLVSKNEMTATEAIDNISAGLTGTGLMCLGILLAAQGLIRGNGADDEDEREFEELMGHQAYSLELPNGKSVTLDWLAPESLPFFTGVNYWETRTGKNEEITFSEILSAVSNISDPMLQMSFLQGLNDIVEGVGYASSNDTSGLIAVLSSATTSYLMQGIPTLFGQIERTGESERMTTYTEKNSFLTGDMQYTLGKVSAKIPFWDYNQIPYIDAWGRKEASGSALKRGLNNFLNPAYTSNIETSDMENELLRLFESTGDGGVFPSRADKYFTVDKERKDLTAEEYVRYATLKGEKSLKAVTDLVNSKAYKKLDDEEKAKAIKEAYDYANQKAKQAISNYRPQNWVSKADEFSNVGNYISFKAEVSSTKAENGGKISKEDVVDIILDMAENNSDTWKMYLSEYESKADKYAYKNGIDGDDYMRFLLALKKYDRPNKNGNYGTYTQEEELRAVNSLKGVSKRDREIIYRSQNLPSNYKVK